MALRLCPPLRAVVAPLLGCVRVMPETEPVLPRLRRAGLAALGRCGAAFGLHVNLFHARGRLRIACHDLPVPVGCA